jgi:probable F420-dependent oxidoreductase
MTLGTFGIWRVHGDGMGPLAELESLGYGALWLGGSPSLEDTRPWLEASSTIAVATGIVNVWRHEAAGVAAGHAELRGEFGERFLLGVGIGHPEATSDYRRPLAKMRDFLDGLDSADPPVPRDERVVAALGPKMLDLAAERSVGVHPYFTPVEHTRFARERIGAGPLIAAEVAVVVESDAESAREQARVYAERHLRLANYASNLLRFGFSERDLADGGSDRLIDAVIPHGSPERIADAVRAHLEAGADHVCIQPVGHGTEPIEDYRALAATLL